MTWNEIPKTHLYQQSGVSTSPKPTHSTNYHGAIATLQSSMGKTTTIIYHLSIKSSCMLKQFFFLFFLGGEPTRIISGKYG